MFDRRVIRGNTYALHTLPAVSYLNFRIKFYFFLFHSMLNQILLKFNVSKKLNDVL